MTLTLLEHLADPDEDPDVRGEAAEQLALVPGTGAAAAAAWSRTCSPASTTPSPEVRFWCAYALATLRVRRAMPRLRELAADPAAVPQFWTVGEEAVWAIMTIVHGTWPAPMEPEYLRPLELPPLRRHELSARRGRAPAPRTPASGAAGSR